MGIDYSISIGYGIAIPEDEVPQVLKDYEPYEDGEIPDWLDENGFDTVGFTYGGDFMSGVCYYFFFDPDTYFRGESHYLETLYEFSVESSKPEVGQQLKDLAVLFGVPKDKIGWKLISNVS